MTKLGALPYYILIKSRIIFKKIYLFIIFIECHLNTLFIILKNNYNILLFISYFKILDKKFFLKIHDFLKKFFCFF